MTLRHKRVRQSLLGLVAAFSLFATSCGGGSADTASVPAAAAPSESAPAESTSTEPAAESVEGSLVVSTVNGEQIDFASLQGQDVVLWFWAPW